MSTSLEVQTPLPGMTQYEKPDTPASILRMAIQQGAPVDTIERLVKLQMDMERFQWEREERQLKSDFDDALSECQEAVKRIAPNQKRGDTGSWWADYAQLDRELRPIYTPRKFAISFSEAEPVHSGKVRVKAILSRKGVSREFFSEITPSTTGPKGNAMATPTDADAIAQSRAKRYLLLDIFNIAVGIDKEEKQGIPPSGEGMTEKEFAEWMSKIEGARSLKELEDVYFGAAAVATKAGDQGALKSFGKAKNDTYKQNGGWR